MSARGLLGVPESPGVVLPGVLPHQLGASVGVHG